jgi:hypothetical protein
MEHGAIEQDAHFQSVSGNGQINGAQTERRVGGGL